MNNTKKSLVPLRRFKEFQNAGAWERHKLGDVAIIVGGGTPSTNITDYWDGAINWYSPEEINEQIYVNSSKKKITKLGLIKSSATMLPVGTVLFTSRAGIGKTAILGTEACTNQGFQSIVPREKELNSYFIYSMTSQLKHYGETHGAGSTFVEVSGKQMAKMPILLPKYEEQVRISSMFKELDSLITLHQRKLNKLKKLKSAYLTEMFPAEGERKPKRRFAGFTDDWEQHQWSDTINISKDMVDPRLSDYQKLFHIGPGNIESFTGILKNNVRSVKDEKLISGKFHFYPNDVIYGKINPQLGKYYFALFEGLSSADTYILESKSLSILTQRFIYYVIQTFPFYKYTVSVSMRTGIPKINRKELDSFRLKLPSIKEQNKINILLETIENITTLQQRKIDKLKKLKDAYLNEMFV